MSSSQADAAFIAKVRETLSQPFKATGMVTIIQTALADRDRQAAQETAYVAGVGDTTQAVGQAMQASNGDQRAMGGFLQNLMAETARQGYGQPAPDSARGQRAPLAIESSGSQRPGARAFGQPSRRG
jgi:hypothetical protein